MTPRSTIAALGLVATAACTPSPPATAAFVQRWLDKMYALVRVERLAPPIAARVYAYGAVALYEGLVHGSPDLRSLAGQLNGLTALPQLEPGTAYDWPTVAASAEGTVLSGLFRAGFPTTISAVQELRDSLINARVQGGVSEGVRARSVAYGDTLGKAILTWAGEDGFLQSRGRPYQSPRGRGYWVPTSTAEEFRAISLSRATDLVQLNDPRSTLKPGEASERMLLTNRPKGPGSETVGTADPLRPLEPYWGELRPFVLTAGDECRPEPPASYAERRDTEFFHQARAVYDSTRDLSEEKKQIALFWDDSPGKTGTPAGHWVGIMSNVAEQLQPDIYQAAEAYALLSIAMADAFISCWEEKYRSNVVRPVTYIHRVIDPNWDAFLVTPPFPEYTSGHSVQSAAAATVLTSVFGDGVGFVDDVHLNIGQPARRFASFRTAANEAAISRLYGGIHYPMAIEHGITQGNCVGRKVLERVQTRTR